MGITIYVTYLNLKEAKKTANHLLKKKLIGCATFFPVKSQYWWNGKIQSANEVVTLLTSTKEKWNQIKSEIKKIHSYEVPCIKKFEFRANKDFEDFLKKVIK